MTKDTINLIKDTGSTALNIRQTHPKARRMLSHNRKWLYVYHIEDSFVIVDRIIPAKMNKG